MSTESGLTSSSHEPLLWFAMSATYGRELKAKTLLEKENIECFVPMRYAIKKDKEHKSERKLVSAISNLIFVRTTRERIKYLKLRIEYLHFLVRHYEGKNRPIVVPDYQMLQFISVCNTYNEKLQYLSPEEVDLAKGTKVRIIGGSFDGVEGTFVKVAPGKRRRVFVMVEGLIGVMLTQISDGYIQVLDT